MLLYVFLFLEPSIRMQWEPPEVTTEAITRVTNIAGIEAVLKCTVNTASQKIKHIRSSTNFSSNKLNSAFKVTKISYFFPVPHIFHEWYYLFDKCFIVTYTWCNKNYYFRNCVNLNLVVPTNYWNDLYFM